MFFSSLFCSRLLYFWLAFQGGHEAAFVSPSQLDLGRMRQGTPVLVMFDNKQRVGQMVLHINQRDGQLIVQDRTSVPGFNIEEKITVTMDAKSRAPITAEVEAMFGENSLDVDLKWTGHRVTGRLARGPEEKTVNQKLAPDTFTRVALFALLPAFAWKEGAAFRVDMFDVMSAKNYSITLLATEKTKVDVLAGRFEAWRVEVNGHEVRQAFYISTATPAQTVKIEVLDTSWHYELTHTDVTPVRRDP